MKKTNKLVLPLTNKLQGFSLTAELLEVMPGHKEIIIGIEDKNGSPIQDIAIICQKYILKETPDYEPIKLIHSDAINVKVYEDEMDEDFTYEQNISLYTGE